MEKKELPVDKCPECGGLNGGHSSYRCSAMTLEEAQDKIIEVEQRWIKVNSRMASGNQKSFSRLKTAIAFYQGKYNLVKEENNKLRKHATKLVEAEEKHKQLIKTLLEIEDGKRKELEEKIKVLERWKAEAICLLSKIDDYADKHPDIKPGMSKVDFTIDRAMNFDKIQKQANGWRPLLEEALKENNHTAMYPDNFINKVKTFLYGE